MKHIRTMSTPSKATVTGTGLSYLRQLLFFLTKGQSWSL